MLGITVNWNVFSKEKEIASEWEKKFYEGGNICKPSSLDKESFGKNKLRWKGIKWG